MAVIEIESTVYTGDVFLLYCLSIDLLYIFCYTGHV